MADTSIPQPRHGERETLVSFLDYLRDCLIGKLKGVEPVAARTPGVPSGTNLMWLVKHTAAVELFWLHYVYGGVAREEIVDDSLTDDDTPESVIAFYRQVAATSRTLIGRADSLDREAVHVPFGPPRATLRWVLAHLIEETARHAGHADILREQIDGLTGR